MQAYFLKRTNAGKALLDTIYLRKTIPFHDESDISPLDNRRLQRLANDFPASTRALLHILGKL